MNLLPAQSETLVLAISAKKVYEIIAGVTKEPSRDEPRENSDQAYQFNGTVDEEKFTLSPIIRHAQNFVPIINGVIEPTSQGSIVFIRYSLFFSSKVFLYFWSTVIFLTVIFSLFLVKRNDYALIAFLIGLFNYAFTIASFNRLVNRSKESLSNLLKEPKDSC
ncbi:MAG: hypothetical protein AAFX87_06940 [Bacteroidota bacterium]